MYFTNEMLNKIRDFIELQLGGINIEVKRLNTTTQHITFEIPGENPFIFNYNGGLLFPRPYESDTNRFNIHKLLFAFVHKVAYEEEKQKIERRINRMNIILNKYSTKE